MRKKVNVDGDVTKFKQERNEIQKKKKKNEKL